ncbi:hypothetical protein D3C87_887630 [compost metagenome]
MARRLFASAEQTALFPVGVIYRGGVDGLSDCHIAGRLQTNRSIGSNVAADDVEVATCIG